MTPKQQRFCDEYLIDLNATQAAIRAGYSKRTAQAIGAENLTKPLLKEYIEKRMAEKESELINKIPIQTILKEKSSQDRVALFR